MTTELFSLSVQQLPVGCVHVYSAVIPSFFFSFFSSLKFSMQTCACPVLTIFECFNLFSGTSKIKQRKPNSSLCGLICVCLWVCVCVRERERERERESVGDWLVGCGSYFFREGGGGGVLQYIISDLFHHDLRYVGASA